MAASKAPTEFVDDNGGNFAAISEKCVCSSDPVPSSGDGNRSDCDGVGAKPAKSNQTRMSEVCSEQSSRTVRKGKGGILRQNRKMPKPLAASSSTSASSLSSDVKRRFRIGIRRREVGRRVDDAHVDDDHVRALALPLGMSIAAVIAQVLDKSNSAGEKISADRLSMICVSAIGESIANVFGGRFNSFMRNFEKSFNSTLKTLLLIREASVHENISNSRSYSSEATCPASRAPTCLGLDSLSGSEESLETAHANNLFDQVVLHRQTNQQLSFASRNTSASEYGQSALSTFQRSVMEQTRSNDLKTFELALDLQRLSLKRSQVALSSDANWLERIKLSMGISKASFKEEKLKTQLQEIRYAELLEKCIDCLVAGLLVMVASLMYGAYTFSFKRLSEATTSCTPSSKVSNSWWVPNPMASLTSGFHLLRCHVVVLSRMLFGLLMILALAYSLLQRAATSRRAMPITFILLLLGIACGIAGKLCVDTLGGSGYCWLFYWETLCLLHFSANGFTAFLFRVLHGQVSVSQEALGEKVWVPYYLRRVMFYSVVLVVLPVLCGLMPFASLVEWQKRFISLLGT